MKRTKSIQIQVLGRNSHMWQAKDEIVKNRDWNDVAKTKQGREALKLLAPNELQSRFKEEVTCYLTSLLTQSDKTPTSVLPSRNMRASTLREI